jgi:hypothetical protein
MLQLDTKDYKNAEEDEEEAEKMFQKAGFVPFLICGLKALHDMKMLADSRRQRVSADYV